MSHNRQNAKLPSRGNMTDMQDKNGLDGTVQSFHSGGGIFEIHVKGYLNDKWSDWLEGLEVRLFDNGEMILSGTIVDQAALIGILNKLNRLNLTLLSVSEVSKKNEV
jgi:hypothetical protein